MCNSGKETLSRDISYLFVKELYKDGSIKNRNYTYN